MDHVRAENAVRRYVEAVQDRWQSLSEQERAGSQIPARTRELLGWARQMTLLQRNLARDQHGVIQKASHYHGAVSRPAGIQIEA